MRLHELIDLLDIRKQLKKIDARIDAKFIEERADEFALDSINNCLLCKEDLLAERHLITEFCLEDILHNLSHTDYKAFVLYSGDLINHNMFKLPYDKVSLSFHFHAENNMIVEQKENNHFEIRIFQELDPTEDIPIPIIDALLYKFHFITDEIENNPSFVIDEIRELTLQDQITEELQKELLSAAQVHISAMLAIVGLLSSEGAIVDVKKAPKFINKKRIAKGLAPIGDLHEIKIVVGGVKYKVSGDSESGTKKRLHWRRGHIRRLHKGGITNVRPCLVGQLDGKIPQLPTYKIEAA